MGHHKAARKANSWRGCSAYHAEGALEGLGLRLGPLVLEEGREVEEEGLDVRQLFERTAQEPHALTGRVGLARTEPRVADHADATCALAHERHRLVGGEQRRQGRRLERVHLLPPDKAEFDRLSEQPLDAHEDNVAAAQRLDQPVIERRECCAHLDRQRRLRLPGAAREDVLHQGLLGSPVAVSCDNLPLPRMPP